MLFSAVAACVNTESSKPILYFSGIPDQNISTWSERYSILENYLTEELGVEVKGIPSKDYASVVIAFEQDQIQLGWFGGLSGVQARMLVEGSNAVAQRARDAEFQSVFVVGHSVTAESLPDLKGLTFTFGSESSTSGHLMPRHYLVESGVDPDTDFYSAPGYSGSHDKTWLLVQTGAFEAGALSEAVWDKAVAEGRADTSQVREMLRTPEYYDYNWTVRPGLDFIYGEGFESRLVSALLNIEDPEILNLFSAERFIATSNDNYDSIATIARGVGIIR
tara:strand:+ start:1367 stop:2197 length:831 start_codon:yes stop_codon:yes gene_type:complete